MSLPCISTALNAVGLGILTDLLQTKDTTLSTYQYIDALATILGRATGIKDILALNINQNKK